MKIDNNHLNPLNTQKTENLQQVEKQQRMLENTQSSPQRDRLELSEKARLLSKARMEMDETQDINQGKVERLKEAINQGTYQIPYAEVAKKILGNIDIKG